MTSKLRWQRNTANGLTLQRWHEFRAMPVGKSFYDWKGVADVFKAARGNRWVIRVGTGQFNNYHIVYDQYSAHSLREAMRMAKFLVGVKYGG